MGTKTVFTYVGLAAVPLIFLNGALYLSQCQLHDGGACSLTAPHHDDDGDRPSGSLRLPVAVTVTQSPPPEDFPFLLRNSAANFTNSQYVPGRRGFPQ
jgi:hypothetical protein